jgi:uncharacterized protein YdaU (DUF1376 family)
MTRTRPPSIDFYYDDFFAGVAGMHPLAVGMYIRTICFQYEHGAAPNNKRRLKQITGTTDDDFKKYWPAVAEKLVLVKGVGWVNKRAQAELEKKMAIARKRSEAGKKGGRTRKEGRSHPESKCLANAKQMLSKCLANASDETVNTEPERSCGDTQRPLSGMEEIEEKRREEERIEEKKKEKKDQEKKEEEKTREKKRREKNIYSAIFEEFWKAFPCGRKKSKGAADKAFSKASALVDAEVLIRRAHDYANSDEGQSDFVKMPSTWLNQRCWEDDEQAWKGKTDGRTSTRPSGTYAPHGEPGKPGSGTF